MARIPVGSDSGSESGSDSTSGSDTDTANDNRRAAVEEDPGIDVTRPSSGGGVDTTPDDTTSNREAAVEQDTGRDVEPDPTFGGTDDSGTSNRQDAVTSDPGNDTPASTGDTTPDDTTSNREAAVNDDPAQEIDRTGGTQVTESDPTDARRDAVEDDPGNDTPVRPGSDPADAARGRQRAVEQDTGQPVGGREPVTVQRQQSAEFESIREQVAAGRQGMGPGDFVVSRTGDGEFSIQLSDAAQREQATAGTPTLDAGDVEIASDGSIQLTDSERESRLRQQASLQTGVSQDEINVFDTPQDQQRVQLSDAGFESFAREQAAQESERFDAADFRLTSDDGRRGVTLTDEALREQAAREADVDGVQAGDLRVTGDGGERSVSLTQDGRERLQTVGQEEQFGDFAIELPGGRRLENVLGDAGETFSERVAEPTGDAVSDIVDVPARFATIGLAGAGVAAENAGLGRVSSGLDTAASITARGGAQASRGVESAGQMGVEILNLPATAVGVKEAGEFVGFYGSETFDGNIGGATGQTASAALSLGREARDYTFANPNQAAGAVAGGLIGSSGAIRAARSAGGARAGTAISAAIQPGEELAAYLARTGRISDDLATRVPGVRQGQRSLRGDERGQLEFSSNGDGEIEIETNGGSQSGVPDSYGGGDPVESGFDDSVAADLRQDSLTQAQDQLRSTATREFEASDTGINAGGSPFGRGTGPAFDPDDTVQIGPRRPTADAEQAAGQTIPSEVTEQLTEARRLPDADLRTQAEVPQATPARTGFFGSPAQRVETGVGSEFGSDTRLALNDQLQSELEDFLGTRTAAAGAVDTAIDTGFETQFETRTQPATEVRTEVATETATETATEPFTETATETDTVPRFETRTDTRTETGREQEQRSEFRREFTRPEARREAGEFDNPREEDEQGFFSGGLFADSDVTETGILGAEEVRRLF